MEVSKLVIAQNSTLNRREKANLRLKRLAEISNEDWQKFTNRNEIAKAVGIINRAAGAEWVYHQIVKGRIVERRVPGAPREYYPGKIPISQSSKMSTDRPTVPKDRLSIIIRKGVNEIELTIEELMLLAKLTK